MIGVRGESKWKFQTSGGGGFTLEFFAATGGEIVLKDPSGRYRTLYYGGVGIGAGTPIKIPRFGRFSPHRLNLTPYGRSVSVAGAPTVFPNIGDLLILDGFPKPELELEDIIGGVLVAELSGFVIGGGSVQAFLLGC